MEMAIASLAMNMHQVNLQNAVSTAMLKKTMEMEAQAMNNLLEGFAEVAPAPSFGHSFDVLV